MTRPPAPPTEDAPPGWLAETGLVDFVRGSWREQVAEELSGMTWETRATVLASFRWIDPPIVEACRMTRGGSVVLSRVRSILGHVTARGGRLRRNSELCAPGRCGQSPLHVAAHVGNVKLVRLLLASGASPLQGDVCGQVALHYAARAGNADVVRLLAQAAPLAVGIRHACSSATPLHVAVSHMTEDRLAALKTTRALVVAGAPLGARDWKGRTAAECLEMESLGGDMEAVVSLLRPDIKTRDIEAAIFFGSDTTSTESEQESEEEETRPPRSEDLFASSVLSAARAIEVGTDHDVLEKSLAGGLNAEALVSRSSAVHTHNDAVERQWMRAVVGRTKPVISSRGERNVEPLNIFMVEGSWRGALWAPRSMSPLQLGSGSERVARTQRSGSIPDDSLADFGRSIQVPGTRVRVVSMAATVSDDEDAMSAVVTPKARSDSGGTALDASSEEARDLPFGWRAAISRKSGRVYYVHMETKRTSWEKPGKEEV